MSDFDIVLESVPSFTRRVGDQGIQGSNNVLLVLGRDRPSPPKSGVGGAGAGTFHLVCGRSSEDPSFSDDKSFVYVSCKTAVDKNLRSSGIESIDSEGPSIVLKTDHTRIVSRKDVKLVTGESYICVSDSGETTVESKKIMLGKRADQKLILGTNYRNSQKSLHDSLSQSLTIVQQQLIQSAALLKAPPLALAAAAIEAAVQAIKAFEQSSPRYLSSVSSTL